MIPPCHICPLQQDAFESRVAGACRSVVRSFVARGLCALLQPDLASSTGLKATDMLEVNRP